MNLFLRRKLSLCLMGALCVVSGWAQFPSSTQLPLVAETDFSVSKSGAPFYSIEDVDGFGNSIIRPTLSVNKISLLDEVSSTVSKSSFFEKNVYAVTSNPIQVDSLRLLDNGDDEWGIIFSGGKSGLSPGTRMLDFAVDGLNPNSSYRVEIEIANPLSENYMSTDGSSPKPHLSVGYSSQLRCGVNSESSPGQDLQLSVTKSGSHVKATIKSLTTYNQDIRPIDVDGRLTVSLFCGGMNRGEAIMIKSIKVYAEPKLEVRASSKEACVGGEIVTLTTKTGVESSSI